MALSRKTVKAPGRTLAAIGWRERVRLPGLGIGPFVAKIDTGARSAALHAELIELRGRKVRFRVPTGSRYREIEAAVRGERRIKNSGGATEMRYVIETDIVIGPDRFVTEITLTDRSDMGVPMLLGRAAIRGRYLVDPGRSFVRSRRSASP